MEIKGTITIDMEKKTVTLRLENGSCIIDHYTNGIKRFLDEEIEWEGLYQEAVNFVITKHPQHLSLVQGHLRISYSTFGHLIERMKREGVIDNFGKVVKKQ